MMRIEAIEQCDVMLPGKAHPASRRRALFPGQRYELPDDTDVAALVKAGMVRVLKDDTTEIAKGRGGAA